MSALLTLDALSASTSDGQALFRDLTLAIGTEKVGLVGRNGSGKSTLLRILAGESDAYTGTFRQSGSIGVLRQEMPESWTIEEALGIADKAEAVRRIIVGDAADEHFAAADWGLDEQVDAALKAVGHLRYRCNAASAHCRAGNASASASRGCGSRRPICSCSMSRPTISTPPGAR